MKNKLMTHMLAFGTSLQMGMKSPKFGVWSSSIKHKADPAKKAKRKRVQASRRKNRR